MRRGIYVWLMFVWVMAACQGPETDRAMPRFSQITEADGLRSNLILHTMQLDDGRMVITTDSCVNVYSVDGKIQQYSLPMRLMRNLPHYQGHYNVFVDDEQRLWVKEYGMVWCLDLATGQCVDLADWVMDDVYVDSQHRLWTVSDTIISDTYHYTRAWGELQDLEADSLHIYLFFSSGIIACYDLRMHQLEYTSQPYNSDEALDYTESSLLRRSPDGRFYQLRCGAKRNIFLSFDPSNRTWRTVFETSQGLFHTLCIANPELALLSCRDGLWRVNLQTGAMQLHSELLTQRGDTIHTGINTVFYDRDGGLWLGTYDGGALHSPTLYASPSRVVYYIVIVFIFVILVLIGFFLRYASRQRRREHMLMQRLHTLHEQVAHPSTEEEEKAAAREEEAIAPMGEDHELVRRAAELVEKNLSVSGYNVEQLAADLCMERTGLYRKLTTLLDQSPTLFIRSIRLERAAALLRETDLSVQEVSERCGFASPGYFSRLFQQTYGKKPSEFRQ